MESAARSLAKAVSWRIVGLAVTLVVALAVTGDYRVALAVGLSDTLVKVLIFYAHERAWNRISFGRKQAPEYNI